nr:hypothetical protein [Brevibacillus agri]
MPSFDIVSEVDLQEARNGVDNAVLVQTLQSKFVIKFVTGSKLANH